ncbi:MAG TPA: NfeD family protein [Longimicrobiales bacterium]|nr:NfeD family protein [Longimicrobiales bacterium]
MRRRIATVLLALGVVAGAAGIVTSFGQSGAAGPDQAPAAQVYRIPVSGVIELGLAPFIERTIREAEQAGASAIVLDIETPGGRVDAAQRITTAVQNTSMPVYAYVNMHAHSAGAMIALSADEIFMRPGSVIGAATPVTGEGETAPEKIVSAMRAEMRALAERRDLDPRVAEAMVDDQIEIEGVIAAGQLLTLTASEAIALGYARDAGDWNALMADLDLAGAQVYTAETNWAERTVRFLTHPAVAPMLLSLGFLGLIIEVKTAGLGIAGLIGASALTAFFGSHLLLGLAGWEEIILLGVGVTLLVVEMFVIPGFGIAGIIGALAILAAFYLSMVGHMATNADYAQAFGLLSLSLIVVIVAGWALLRHLGRSRAAGRSGLMLSDATTRETGYLSAEVRAELVGTVGVALTDLRPAGAGRFGSERVDVVSDANWIGAGTPIRIVRSDGYRHVVEPVEPGALPKESGASPVEPGASADEE